MPNDTTDLCANTKYTSFSSGKLGGTDGIRDSALLESAANAPFQTFDGEDIFKTLREQAAHLGYYLIKNHPFTDGNKRTGIMTVLTFLELNGIHVDCSDAELIQVGFALADNTMGDKQLLQWLIDHS